MQSLVQRIIALGQYLQLAPAQSRPASENRRAASNIWTQITLNLHDQSIMATGTRKLAEGHEGLNNVCEKLPLAQTYHLLDTADEMARRDIEASRSDKRSGKTNSPAK